MNGSSHLLPYDCMLLPVRFSLCKGLPVITYEILVQHMIKKANVTDERTVMNFPDFKPDLFSVFNEKHNESTIPAG
jgi:hypothetical protein